jgi:hypothetical protein
MAATPNALLAATLTLAVACGGNPEAPRADAATSDAPRDSSSGSEAGHGCPIAGCVVITLAAGLTDPLGIAVDATNVYWTDSTLLLSMPLDGGTRSTLATGVASELTVYEGYVYLSPTTRVPSGGAPLQTTVSYSSGLPFQGTNVYWGDNGGVNGDNGFIVRSPAAGGAVTTLASLGEFQAASIAVDSSSIFWVAVATTQSGGTLMSMPLAGGKMATLLSGDSVPYQIAVAGGSLYGVGATVTSMPVGGGSILTLASINSAGDNAGPFAVDDENVYWPELDAGTVLMVGRTGGRVTTLAAGRNGPENIAIDSTYVYWTERRNNDILKVAIP